MTVEAIVAAAFVGLAIGVLSGLLGIGGGIIMVPVFRLGFGLSAIVSTATSLFTIIPTAVAGCITHIRQKTCVVPLGLLAGCGGALMSPVGVWLARISPSWAIMLAAALVIAYAAVTMFRKALRASKGAAGEEPPVALARAKLMLGFPIGLAAGLVAGYVGVGGGFIMTPLFISLVGISMKQSSGTSLLAIAVLAIPGVIEQLICGNVAVAIGIAIAVGSIPGAVVGAMLVKRISERKLRFAFSFLLLAVAVILAVREFAL